MQVLHFSYAFGAFLAPLIARQFISAEQDVINSNTTDNDYNASGWGGCVATGCDANSTLRETGPDEKFQIAYWLSSLMLTPTLLAYIFYDFRYEVVRCFSKIPGSLSNESQTTYEPEEDKKRHDLSNDVSKPLLPLTSDTNGQMSDKMDEETKPIDQLHPLWFIICILLLLSTFLFFYVGLESSYGNWIFTVAVTGSLDFSKSMGTVIQSLFWGTFAFTRLFSVLLAVLNVKSSVMITGNLTGSVIASVIMVSSPHNATAIWLASAVLGMSYASIFPTVMTWMSETIEPTGKATSVLITGGGVGAIVFPAAMGELIYKVSPDTLFYVTFAGIVLCVTIVSIMFVLRFWKHSQ